MGISGGQIPGAMSHWQRRDGWREVKRGGGSEGKVDTNLQI